MSMSILIIIYILINHISCCHSFNLNRLPHLIHNKSINNSFHTILRQFDKFKGFHQDVSHKLSMARRNQGFLKRKKNNSNLFTITNILIASNAFIFVLVNLQPWFLRKIIKSDYMIARGQYYRLLTCVFAHKDMFHIMSNCYSLNNIGPYVNSLFGNERYLITYLFAGLFGSTVSYILGTSPLALGASGAVYGLIGALATFYFRNRGLLGQQANIGLFIC